MYSGNKYLVHSIMACLRQNIIECQVGFPIRKSPDQSLFAAPRRLSQRTTSFIASYRLGIHQTPFSRLIRDSESGTFLSPLRAGHSAGLVRGSNAAHNHLSQFPGVQRKLSLFG